MVMKFGPTTETLGGTGDPPVSFGDSPDGTGRELLTSSRASMGALHAISVGESPTWTGVSPVPPNLKRAAVFQSTGPK